MSDFSIDDALSQFGSKPAAASKSKNLDFDVDAILKSFEGDGKPAAVSAKPDTGRIYVGPPKPPISDSPNSDAINYGEAKKSQLPVEAPLFTSEGAYENNKAGKELFSSGVEDLQTGHPYKGIGKAALGALGVAASPVSGIIDDLIVKPGNKVGPGFGDRAGFVASAAVPVVPGAGAVLKALPKTKALSTLVENIGPENLPAVVSAMKANPRLAPADLSPRVLQDTQHLFTQEGPQIDYLAKTSAARMGGAKDAIDMAYDTSAGVSVDLAKKIDDLAKAAKKVGDEQINPIIKAAKPVNTNNTVSEIDKILKPGAMSKITGESELPLSSIKAQLKDIRGYLASKTEVRTDPEDLHRFQSRLRVTAENLLKSTDGNSKNLGNQLLEVRRNLIDDIEKSAPGYKTSLSNYRDEKHVTEAFKEGYDGLFSSSKSMENTPSFIKQWFEGLSDAEKQAAREGARASIATEIGVARNPALAGERLARSDFNQEKLRILFGKEEANKLIKTLEEERAIANTHNKVIEGTQTAMRSASKSQFALPTATEVMRSAPAVAATEAANFFMGGYPGVGSAALTVAKGGAMAKDAIKMKLAREHNAQYAKYALPTQGPSRDELIKALEAHIPGPKPSLLARGTNALSRIVAP